MLSVFGAAAMAYVDVQVMKKELTLYQKSIQNIEESVSELRKETNEGFKELRIFMVQSKPNAQNN